MKNVNNEALADDYNDTPDYSGYCPDCPKCGETMRYSYCKSEFKCFVCGCVMDEHDWDYCVEDENTTPFVCCACGGPWPSCKTSCKMFDD